MLINRILSSLSFMIFYNVLFFIELHSTLQPSNLGKVRINQIVIIIFCNKRYKTETLNLIKSLFVTQQGDSWLIISLIMRGERISMQIKWLTLFHASLSLTSNTCKKSRMNMHCIRTYECFFETRSFPLH